MADYKDIIGTAVRNNAGNLPSAQEKELFFDTTNVDFKYQFAAVLSSWRTGNNLNAARTWPGDMSIGTQTSSLVAGKGPPGSGETESYNGTSWTEVSDLNNGRYSSGGVGPSNTSALVFGGENYPTPSPYKAETETWNGSGWTEVADLNTARQAMGSSGNLTSALAFGGEAPGDAHTQKNESWNGSAWTEVADLNQGKRFVGGAGANNTEALCFGGFTPPVTLNVETWNGSSWTETTNMNTARYGMASSGTIYTAAIGAGGDAPPNTGATEIWNGSSWTETGDLNTARKYAAGGGTSTSCLASGGTTGSNTAATEEFTADAAVGTWSSQPTMNNPRVHMGASPAGTSTAALASGGVSPESSDQLPYVESYNGTAWTEVADLNTPRKDLSAGGTYTSNIAFGGETGGGTKRAETEVWNGSSWTEVADLNRTVQQPGGCGASSTSALAVAGLSPGTVALTEVWNGSSWTETGDLGTARIYPGVSGIATAALAFGGGLDPGTTANTEQFNGSSWTELNNLNSSRSGVRGFGTYTAAIACMGNAPSGSPGRKLCEDWNGVSWQETTDLNTDMEGGGTSGGAGSASGLAYGDSSYAGATEEWTNPGTTIKVLTD